MMSIFVLISLFACLYFQVPARPFVYYRPLTPPRAFHTAGRHYLPYMLVTYMKMGFLWNREHIIDSQYRYSGTLYRLDIPCFRFLLSPIRQKDLTWRLSECWFPRCYLYQKYFGKLFSHMLNPDIPDVRPYWCYWLRLCWRFASKEAYLSLFISQLHRK